MAIDKKELSKLSPEERIEKLRLMEEERKKEVNEIERLIKESMQELKADKLAEGVAPEQRAVDISRLFEVRGEERLERTTRQEAPSAASPKGAAQYQTLIQTYDDYRQLRKFDSILSMGGILSEGDIASIDQIGARINVAESYIPVGEKTVKLLDASRMVLYKLKKETGLG